MLNPLKRMSLLQERNRIYAIFALCSIVSSGLGILILATDNPIYYSLMRMSAGRPVSIVSSIVAIFLPYFVSVLVVTNSKHWIAYFICSVQIFLFSAAYSAVCQCFNAAGSLICYLLMFPHILLIPMLITSALRRLTWKSGKRDTIIGCMYTTTIAIINHCAVSPFLAKIIITFEANG